MNFRRQSEIVKLQRKLLALSQVDLAYRLGIPGQQVSNIERNYQGIPPSRIREFSRILKIPRIALVDAISEDYKEYLCAAGGV